MNYTNIGLHQLLMLPNNTTATTFNTTATTSNTTATTTAATIY